MININKNILQNTAALSGIAVFTIGIPGLMFMGFLKPGYDPFCHTVSKLGEFGGYNYRVVAFLFIISGIFEIIYAAGLMSALQRNLSSVTGTILLILHGVFDNIGSGIFPCDFGGLHESFSGQMHLLLAAIGMLALLIAPYFFWRAFYRDSRFSGRRLVNFTALIALIITGVVIAGITAGAFKISFIANLAGLMQRSVYFPYYIWILVVSIKMLRDEQYH